MHLFLFVARIVLAIPNYLASPLDTTTLVYAVDACLKESPDGSCPHFAATHGHIGDWDVSRVTSMHGLFQFAANFTQDLSKWNTSAVTDISQLFYGATQFNQDISRWDVRRVTNMAQTFREAHRFNQDISSWVVSRVTTMRQLFFEASDFNQDISKWDVSNVTDMGGAFQSATNFNYDLSPWVVTNVESAGFMFKRATAFNHTLCGSSWVRSNFSAQWPAMFKFTDGAGIANVVCADSATTSTTLSTWGASVDCACTHTYNIHSHAKFLTYRGRNIIDIHINMSGQSTKTC